MSNLPPLPGAANADPDLAQALTKLAGSYGDHAVQALIRALRSNDNAAQVADWHARAAARLINDIMLTNPAMTYRAARIEAARRWGYEGKNLPNFHKLADAGWYAIHNTQPDKDATL